MKRRAALIGAAGGLLAGCASAPQSEALRIAAPPGAPRRVELTRVPFYPQTPYHCGPAALATVLTDAGLAATPDQLVEQVFLPAREGALQAEMLAAARRHGALPVRVNGDLNTLVSELAAGHPVVLLQNLGLDWYPRWHYAVLVGYDLDAGHWLLRSGTTERALLGFTPFEQTWTRAGRWAFVAVAPGRLPATTAEDQAIEATLAFERVAKPAAAARAYEAVLARWPGSLIAAMGLGNTALAAGDLKRAADAFERAAQRHDSAAAWNNLAQVRLKQGQRNAARRAAQKAVARAQAAEPQWLEPARETLREVK